MKIMSLQECEVLGQGCGQNFETLLMQVIVLTLFIQSSELDFDDDGNDYGDFDGGKLLESTGDFDGGKLLDW